MSLIQSYIGYAAGHFKETLLTIHNPTIRLCSAKGVVGRSLSASTIGVVGTVIDH